MSKERISASVEPSVAEYLSQDHVNASGLINDLVKRHMAGGLDKDQLREFRRQQIESEIESLRSQLETKQSELQAVEETVNESREEQRAAIDRRLESYQDVQGVIDESHPTVEALAQEHFSGSREQALEAMQERNNELELVPEEYL